MRRAAHCIMAALLATLLGLAGCGPAPYGQGDQRPAAPAKADAAQPGQRVEALCLLAGMAAPAFPNLAKEVLGQALEAAEEQGGPAWAYRLVAESALSVDFDLAGRALERGLTAARELKDARQREEALAGLTAALARRDPAAARRLATGLTLAPAQARAWRELSRLTRQDADLDHAVRAARRVGGPEQASLALARAGEAALGWTPDRGRELMRQAFTLAGEAEPPRRRRLLQGAVAARLARVDPAAGMELAQRVEPGEGVAYAANALAAAGLLPLDPNRGLRAWRAALRQANQLPDQVERLRALAGLAAVVAPRDPEAARAVLARLPASAGAVTGRAQAALVLAEAGRDLDQALELAGRVADPQARLRLRSRLAALLAAREPERARKLRLALVKQWVEQEGPLPRRMAAGVLAELPPAQAVRWVQKIKDPAQRAMMLTYLGRSLAEAGRGGASQWCLYLALDAVKKINMQEMLDKVRLLGDMGREWSVVDKERARAIFQLAADKAQELG